MPKVTIWIRKEDEEKWKHIHDKPAMLHLWINDGVVPIRGIIQFIKESGTLETDATLQQFVDYCESISNIEGDKHGE